MTKLNPQTMKNQYDHQYDTFCRKNHDYGNSFEESLDQFGIVASIVRISDKMKRLESLTDESKTQQVGSESLLDTLEDLSNYAAMTACWLRWVRTEDGDVETSSQKVSKFVFGEVKPDGIDEYKYLESLTINLKEIVCMLQKVNEFHHKIEEFKMTEEDHKELDVITNRLRTILSDDVIDEELMRKLIDVHVKMNPDVILFQLFNRQDDIQATPTEVPEAIQKFWDAHKKQIEYMTSVNNEKTDLPSISFILNKLYNTIYACRDQRLPLQKRLAYVECRQEIYNSLVKSILSGLVDFQYITSTINAHHALNRDEKSHILTSIIDAAYKIDSEKFPGADPNSEFLKKKFQIPDEILKDLKEPEEEPERKRTVLGMIFPFML
jgi:hypothetical protein